MWTEEQVAAYEVYAEAVTRLIIKKFKRLEQENRELKKEIIRLKEEKMNGKNHGWFHPNTNGNGITQRDWLGGLAMQGILTNSPYMESLIHNKQSPKNLAFIAKTSYDFADAMIAESHKKSSEENKA